MAKTEVWETSRPRGAQWWCARSLTYTAMRFLNGAQSSQQQLRCDRKLAQQVPAMPLRDAPRRFREVTPGLTALLPFTWSKCVPGGTRGVAGTWPLHITG